MSGPPYEQVVTTFEIAILQNQIALAATVLYSYDTLTTLSQEITGVWNKPWTISSVVYIANRYIFLLHGIVMLVGTFGSGTSYISCSFVGTIAPGSEVLSQLLTSCLLMLRIYAVYNKNTAILLVLAPVILARFALNIVIDFVELRLERSNNFLHTGLLNTIACTTAYRTKLLASTVLTLRTVLAIAFLSLAFDVIAFALTAIKTCGHFKLMRKHNQASITEVILRDGSVYFFFVFVMGSASAACATYSFVSRNQVSSPSSSLFLLLEPFKVAYATSTVSRLCRMRESEQPVFYVCSLSVMLTNRLYLNLKTWNDPRPGFSGHTHDLPALNFADRRVLGRLGAPVRTMREDEDLYADIPSVEEYSDRSEDPVVDQGTTVIPVVYDGVIERMGDIEMVPIPSSVWRAN